MTDTNAINDSSKLYTEAITDSPKSDNIFYIKSQEQYRKNKTICQFAQTVSLIILVILCYGIAVLRHESKFDIGIVCIILTATYSISEYNFYILLLTVNAITSVRMISYCITLFREPNRDWEDIMCIFVLGYILLMNLGGCFVLKNKIAKYKLQ